ncbi:hypothetical protein [Pseudomonas tohonis]|uniref:hypothetical protein n=1 Tax=Pseudomonas tohonis TaxID=2725477 RepID=UPI001F2EC55A|nr:hypothetical protein [Pseudomonas tohonis]
MQRFINNWSATLLQPAAAAATEFVIDPDLAAGLVGLGSDFYLLTAILEDSLGREVAWEIVKVTSNVAGTLVVVREQEGTVAPATMPAGTRLEARLTAGTMASLLARLPDVQSEFALAIGVGADSETSDRGYSQGGGYGTCSPSSITVQGFGVLQPTSVAFFGADFYVEVFGNQVPQAALASVEVEGVGTLLGSAAGYGYDSGAQSTWFQWDGVGNVWADGESRAVILRFNL